MQEFYPIFAQIAVSALPVLFAITLHETAHGWVANRLGDPTARLQGRLTLNPLPHIDPVYTVLFPILTLIVSKGTFIFGGAKPVPVNFGNLKKPKRDMILVAAAGPGINLGLAFLSGMIFRFLSYLHPDIFSYIHSLDHFSIWSQFDMAVFVPLGLMFLAAVKWNVLLAVFNMIPIPPLDGGRVMVGLLPRPFSNLLSRIEPFGILILIVLIFIVPFGSHYVFQAMRWIAWHLVGFDAFMV